MTTKKLFHVSQETKLKILWVKTKVSSVNPNKLYSINSSLETDPKM